MPQNPYQESFYERVTMGAGKSAKCFIDVFINKLDIVPESVLDVGCGTGVWLKEWAEAGAKECVGIDFHSYGFAFEHPQVKYLKVDLNEGFNLNKRFGLVQCLEVAEHLKPEAAESLVSSLTLHSDMILFSAAVPGQGGIGHVNERHYEYWRDLFWDLGYLWFDVMREDLIGQKMIEITYRYNTFLVINKSAVMPAALLESKALERGTPIKDISSWSFKIRKMVLKLLPVCVVSQLAVFYRSYLLGVKK